MEKTVTKREILEGLITLAETGECTLAAEDIKTFAEKEIASMDKRAAADKKRREAKAAESEDPAYSLITHERTWSSQRTYPRHSCNASWTSPHAQP